MQPNRSDFLFSMKEYKTGKGVLRSFPFAVCLSHIRLITEENSSLRVDSSMLWAWRSFSSITFGPKRGGVSRATSVPRMEVLEP